MQATTKKHFNGTPRPTPARSFNKHLALLTTALSMAMIPSVALAAPGVNALPTGASTGAGTTIATSGNTMTITSTLNRSIVTYNTFNIGQNATVNVIQPGTGSWQIEKVIGSSASPSQIYGTLHSNGGVVVLNANGVEVGAGGQVNVNKFVASTGSINATKFLAGDTNIELSDMNAGRSVVNNGTITVAEAGLVALVGANAANNGTINAKSSHVTIGGVKKAVLDFNGDGLLSIETNSAQTGQDIVANTGIINADGGVVELTAAGAASSLNNLINMSGVINANAATVSKTGQVILAATGSGKVKVSGTINAKNSFSGGTGGSISITGPQVVLSTASTPPVSSGIKSFITLAGANLDTTGAAKNGAITLAALGDNGTANNASLSIGTGSRLTADAITLNAGNSANKGNVTLDSTVTVNNLTFESANAAGMNVGGTNVQNLNASNVTLDTPVNFSTTPTHNPNTITIGHALGSQADVQQAFNWIKTNGTVFVSGVFHPIHPTATKAFTLAGITPDAYISHIYIDNTGFNVTRDGSGNTTVHVPFVTLDVDAPGLLQLAYDMSAGPGNGASFLQLALNFYNDSLNYYASKVAVQSIAPGSVNGFGDSVIQNLTLSTPGGSFDHSVGGGKFVYVLGQNVTENSGSNAQRALDLTKTGGNTFFNFAHYAETVDVNKSENLFGQTGSNTLFDTINVNDGSATFTRILGSTVNANQGSAQTSYDITNANGTLNLGQSNYAGLDAHTAGVNVNGNIGGTTFGSITLDALGNIFNSITTPVVNVNAIGTSQQGIDLVDDHGTVNFGFNATPDSIALNRDLILNGAAGNTIFGQIDVNTPQGQFNNIFGETVNLNTADHALRGLGLTAEGGTLNLSQQIYVPESLNVPYFMTINGAPTFSLFTTVTNSVGAILNRIFALSGPGAGAQGLNLLILDPNSQLGNGKGGASLEALLSALSPAGPGDGDNGPRVCTAHGAQAAEECMRDAMASGRTVVVFDITKNKFSLINENTLNQVVDWHDVTQEELNKILGTNTLGI